MTDKKISALTARTTLDGTEEIPANFGGANFKVTTQDIAGLNGRTLLTQNTQYYVETTGNDGSGDGSIATPWLTLQHAVDHIAQTIDIAGFEILINIGTGTFAGINVNGFVGEGAVIFAGAGESLTTIILAAGTDSILAVPGIVSSIIAVTEVTLDASVAVAATLPVAIYSSGGSGNSMVFGWYGVQKPALRTSRITLKLGDGLANLGGITGEGPQVIYIYPDQMTVNGSAQTTGINLLAPTQGCVVVDFTVWSFTNNPLFNIAGAGPGFILAVWFGVYLALGATYSGAFTGPAVTAIWGSIISFDATPPVGTTANNIDPTSVFAFTNGGANTWGGHGAISMAGAPTTTQLPVSGTWSVFKDTGGGGVVLAYNDSGVIKSVALI